MYWCFIILIWESKMNFSYVGYESHIVPSMGYDKLILCKVKSTDSNMHGQRWMFASLNETLFHKKWFSMYVVREWHMHAKCDQNILCGQELWTFSRTANRRASGRTQIVIIVHTQGSCNSTILKLPLEKGILSSVLLSCQHFETAWLVWT